MIEEDGKQREVDMGQPGNGGTLGRAVGKSSASVSVCLSPSASPRSQAPV